MIIHIQILTLDSRKIHDATCNDHTHSNSNTRQYSRSAAMDFTQDPIDWILYTVKAAHTAQNSGTLTADIVFGGELKPGAATVMCSCQQLMEAAHLFV